MKRLLSTFLAMVMIFACVPFTVFAAEDNSLWKYIIVDGEVTIKKYIGTESVVEIPAEIEGYPVTTIASQAFYLCRLSELSIPDSITYFCRDAFLSGSIENLYISDLGKWCGLEFEDGESNPLYCSRNLYVDGENCKDIVVIPDSVKSISDYAFYRWYTYSYYIPESVKYIGECALYGLDTDDGNIYFYGTYNDWNNICNGVVWQTGYLGEEPYLWENSVFDHDSGFIYSISDDHEAKIYEYYGRDTDVIIPKEINGSSVLMRTGKFIGQNGITSVYFDGTQKEFADMFYSIKGCQSFMNNHIVVFNPVPVEGFVLAGGVDSVTVEIGETFEPVYEVYPENANGVFTYSFNSDCISISKGVITGESAGETTVTVTSESGVTYSFTVKVIGCVGIEIESLPEKVYYSTRQSFDPSGLKIVKLYNDGTTEECTDYTMSSYNSLKKGVQTITVTSGAFTTSFDVFVSGALVGDADLDGKLTAIDSNILKRSLAGEMQIEEKTDSFFACDLNGDGKLNAMDSALLKRMLVG